MADQATIEQRTAGSKAAWAWPLAFLGAVLIVVVGVVVTIVSLGSTTINRGAGLVEQVVHVFKPQETTTTIQGGAITDLKFSRELIVSRSKLEAEVSKHDTLRVIGIYMGTTVSRVKAVDCRVQYTIDLNDFSEKNVTLDPAKRTLTVRFKQPHLDRNIVEIPLDKLQCETAAGWARFNGKELEEEARKGLRDAVIAQGEQSFLKAEVRENATKAVRELLRPITDPLGSDVRVDVEWMP